MFCKNCGNQLNENDAFCKNCGMKNSESSMNGGDMGQEPSQNVTPTYSYSGNGSPENYSIKERSFFVYILLSIITCGIYGIVFWYQYVNDLNTICDGDGKETQNYVVVFLLTIVTCGIYNYIWLYGMGNRLQESAPRYGLTFSENGTSVLMWYLFGSLLCGIGPFIAMHILIKNMNVLAKRYNQGGVPN